ncbi:hypothetical protein [Pseudarthrobacter sulfonivorans]|uniref:hypothetical protein n=1 Tax=Pseudarthrobacter sulfonivorans TaxID=121292 RepID=UPI002855E88E|nr:hypothetical protein [Pseudarthrobacter sulfonivorans]MDR6413313.1 hypothetical protein [Pseudarthrobacter sulfonivorans]
MRTFYRILAGVGVLMATALPASASMAAPPELIIKEDAFVTVTNSCNGDEIYLEGTFHTVVKTNSAGTTKQEAVIHLKGTTTSGTRYVLNQTLQTTFSDSADSGHSIAVLVSLGRQPNETAVFRWNSATSLDSVDVVCSN